jgi:iron(III) transport system substrate-binding protein
VVVVSQADRVIGRFTSFWRNLRGLLAGWICLLMIVTAGCNREASNEIVVYASQDRVYAEPIFQAFTARTGIKVRALYDSEAAKTVGLANRLAAEKSHPQCDVFWNNEELRTWQLAAKGVIETNWVSVGYRTRRLVLNTNSVSAKGTPLGLGDLIKPSWSRKVAIAYPLFGTTATHFLALRQYWGDKKWEEWCRALQANHPFLVDGNSGVVNLVGRGEAWVGLTDSDDVAAAQREGLPISGSDFSDVPKMVIPNTVALIKNRPHPAEAQRLSDFLRDPTVTRQLVEARALDSAQSLETVTDRIQVNYPALLRDLDGATKTLELIFLK